MIIRRQQLRKAALEEAPGHTKCGLVPPIRIERTTYGLGNRCSIQLSYGGVV